MVEEQVDGTAHPWPLEERAKEGPSQLRMSWLPLSRSVAAFQIRSDANLNPFFCELVIYAAFYNYGISW